MQYIEFYSVSQSNEVQNYLRLSAYPSESKLQLLLLVPHLNGNGYSALIKTKFSQILSCLLTLPNIKNYVQTS